MECDHIIPHALGCDGDGLLGCLQLNRWHRLEIGEGGSLVPRERSVGTKAKEVAHGYSAIVSLKG